MLADVSFTDSELDAMLDRVNANIRGLRPRLYCKVGDCAPAHSDSYRHEKLAASSMLPLPL